MAAEHHHAVDPARPVPGDHLPAGHRIAPVEGEEQAGPGQLPAAHRHRALPEIGAEHGLDLVRERAEILHEPGQSAVARAGRALRRRHLLVDGHAFVPRLRAQEGEQSADRRVRAAVADQSVGHHHRAGVDQRVARLALLGLELDDRVERRARRLPPDLLPQLGPDLLERQRQHEHLGDRLDREWLVAIAGAPDAPVLVGEGDAELAGIGPRQRRDVARDRSGAPVRRGRRQHLGKQFVHARIGPAPAAPVKLFHGGKMDAPRGFEPR